MNTLPNSTSILATLAALTLTTGVAHAGTGDSAPQRIDIVGIKLAAPASEIEGLFKLSNGRLLELSRSGHGLIAEVIGGVVRGGVNRELLPVAANRLRSRDGRMELSFSVQPDGTVTDIALSLARG